MSVRESFGRSIPKSRRIDNNLSNEARVASLSDAQCNKFNFSVDNLKYIKIEKMTLNGCHQIISSTKISFPKI